MTDYFGHLEDAYVCHQHKDCLVLLEFNQCPFCKAVGDLLTKVEELDDALQSLENLRGGK